MTALNKPLKRKVTVQKIGHGYRPQLVITLLPSGYIELRESGLRESPVTLDLAALYMTARIHEAKAKLAKRRG